MNKLAKRPTETLTGPVLAGVVYGFETQVGIPPIVSAAVAVVAGFGPLFVSEMVDALKGRR